MESVWINKKNNDKLIVFFNGWSMDKNPLQHLKASVYDVLMLYNHQNLDIEYFKAQIPDSYSEIVLIGWSMGVWAGQYFRHCLDKIKFSIAINGTLEPIHDEYGIPVGIFDATLNNFIPENREKFYKRMFSSISEFRQFLDIQPEREYISQKTELESLKSSVLSTKLDSNVTYNKAIVCSQDKIFPSKNMVKYWENIQVTPILTDAGHYPFFIWQSWEDLIEYAAKN